MLTRSTPQSTIQHRYPTQRSSARPVNLIRFALILALAAIILGGLPSGAARAAAIKNGVNATYSICVRPGGISRPYTFGNDSTPDPAYPGLYPISQIQYNDVVPFNWIITRGYFEYSSNSGASWNPYTLGTWVSVAGTQWHFVDTMPADTTTTNSMGVYWTLVGVPGNIGSGSNIVPDNPPTDITADKDTIFTNTTAGTTVATLTPTDTGCYQDGYWVIDSQSVPNLFTISFDATSGNAATLALGSGVLPPAGQSATVTVRYYDLYQTDSSGDPIPGQGYSETLTFNVIADTSTDLNFSDDAAASAVVPVYSGYGKPQAATLSTGNYVAAWTEFGHGGDAMASTGAGYDYGGIYARQFDDTGTAAAAAFAITPVGDGIDTYEASVSALSAGRYVVAYRTGMQTTNYDIGYRIVEANGTVGSEQIANTTTAGDQSTPAIATLTDGSFVIAWISAGEVHAQKFNAADGSKNGGELTVHAGTSDANPSVAPLSNGDYALAWGNGSDYNVYACVGSNPAGFVALTSDSGSWPPPDYLPRPRVAGLTGGGFVVSWDSYANDLVGYTVSDIFFQRFSNAGAAQGGIVQANTITTGLRHNSSVAALSGGGFVIGWQSDTGDYDWNGVFGRRFSATGVAVDTSDFEINQYRKGDQIMPYMTPLGTDRFAAVWEMGSSTQTTAGGIYTRALLPDAPASCTGVGSGSVPWSVAFASCPPGAKFVIPNGLNVYLDSDISISEDLELQAGGSFNPSGKTVTLTGSSAQTISGNPITFFRLTLNKTNKTDTVTISGKLQVTKKLTVSKGKLISASDYGDIEIGVDGEMELTSSITISGSLTNDGVFTSNTFNVTFDGTTLQTLGGAVQTEFYDWNIAASAKVFIATLPAVANSMVNNGVISQTMTLGPNDNVTFLQISEDRYIGLGIVTDADNDPGQVSVAIRGNDTTCTSNPADLYRNRCFYVNAQNEVVANLTLYSTAGEDDIDDDTAYQYYSAFSSWADIGTEGCGLADGQECPAANATLFAGDNYLVIGNFDESPTAVTLERFTVNHPYLTFEALLAWGAAALLLCGVVAVWLFRKRRIAGIVSIRRR